MAESQGKKTFEASEHLEAEDIKILTGKGGSDADGGDSEAGLTDTKAQDFVLC